MKLLNANYDHFLSYISGKDLICYGAGELIRDVEAEIKGLGILCKQIRIIDGASTKQGKEIDIFGKKIKIEKPEEVLSLNAADRIVLITSMSFIEILDDIAKYEVSDQVVFIFILMLKTEKDFRYISVDNNLKLVSEVKNERIPRLIHCFWIGEKKIPKEYYDNIETWKYYCPDYEIQFWGDKDINIDECKYAVQAYNVGKFGFVPDYFRLKTVYEYGGIYMDLDVKLLKPLDPLLSFEAYAGFEDDNYVAFGVGFGARKKFPLLKEMYEYYHNISFINEDGSLNLTASPVYQTEILKKHGLINNGQFQNISGMNIMPMNILTAQSARTGKKYITDNTISVHQYAASWYSEDGKRNKEKIEELAKEIKMI